MQEYVAQGTISIAAANAVILLHFVPSPEYSIKHWGKDFAVFISSGSTGSDKVPVTIVREYGQRRVIEINTGKCEAGLLGIIGGAAALNGTKVQIRVEAEKADSATLNLVGIEIPAT